MTSNLKDLRAFLDAAPAAALVEVTEAKGSTPREKGAWMLVSPASILSTIGGGQLEFIAIAKAREMLSSGEVDALLDIPLGPEIGQCCGGRVGLAIRRVGEQWRAELEQRARKQDTDRPLVLIFGGGHVGHALAAALALLPVRTVVVETRAEAVQGLPAETVTRLTAMPEEMVREAPSGSAFVVLTHDHALDFLIIAAALRRSDAAYVGMIGSKTKKATFKSWFVKNGGTEATYRRLVCPIGGEIVRDKRPAVIAALTAAEVMRALA
jgi:xanthine dehydrogenase accessory factor